MKFIKEIKPPKTISASYKIKELTKIYQNGNTDIENLSLKKSSLDLTPYTHIEVAQFYPFNAKYLYNEEIITLAFFTGEDYNSDVFSANCFYHKTFKRKDLLDNKKAFLDSIEKIPNNSLKEVMQEALEKDNLLSDFSFSSDLNMATDLPLFTKEGWYSSTEDKSIDCLFLSEDGRYVAKVFEDKIVFNSGFRLFEYRNKIKYEETDLKEIVITDEKLYCKNTYYISNIFDPSSIYFIEREIKGIKEVVGIVPDSYYQDYIKGIVCQEEDGEKFIQYTHKIESDTEIQYFEDEDMVYLLQLVENKKEIISQNKKLVFDFEVVDFIEGNYYSVAREDYILLENGDLYVHFSEYKDGENKYTLNKIGEEVKNIKLIESIYAHLAVLKTDKYIYYMDKGFRWNGFAKIEYSGEGEPFFYELKESKKYDKYTYVLPIVSIESDYSRRGNLVLVEEIAKYPYFELDIDSRILKNSEFSVRFDRENFLISYQGKRNNPYDFFVKSGNYILAISVNKEEVTVIVEENKNEFIEVDYISDYIDNYNLVKNSFSLRNLPDRIEYKKESYSKSWIKFVYSDYFVIVDSTGAKTSKL